MGKTDIDLKDAVGMPQPGDFSTANIRKKIFLEAIQHPSTLIFAAAALLSLAYMMLISFNFTSFAVTMAGSLLTVVSWVFHFFVRGEDIKKAYLDRLSKQQDTYKVQQVLNVAEKCRSAGFYDGQTAAKELQEAYHRLNKFLKEKQGRGKKKSPAIERYSVLAEECYFQGLHFITKALSVFQILGTMDYNKLKEEMVSWEKALKKMEGDKSRDQKQRDYLVNALKERIRSHQKRLSTFDSRRKGMEEALAQCEILEATLDSTYLDVVDLIDDQITAQAGNAAAELERAVSAARRVEDRLRGVESGPDYSEEDAMYAEAGKEIIEQKQQENHASHSTPSKTTSSIPDQPSQNAPEPEREQ